MLWIIGGIVLAVIFFIIGLWLGWDGEPISFLVSAALVIGIVIGLLSPVKEYTDLSVIKEVELVSLNNNVASRGSGGVFYVSVSTNNVYSFRYEVENKYDLGGKAYETATLSNNVTEIESAECIKPVLKVYEKKPIKNKWISFSLFDSSIKEYVFYVPEGTIQKEIVLE